MAQRFGGSIGVEYKGKPKKVEAPKPAPKPAPKAEAPKPIEVPFTPKVEDKK